MMTSPYPCKEVRLKLSPYMDQELSGKERSSLMHHLEGCSACKREWQHLKQVHKLLRESPLIIPSESFYSRVLRRTTGSMLYGWGSAQYINWKSLAFVTMSVSVMVLSWKFWKDPNFSPKVSQFASSFRGSVEKDDKVNLEKDQKKISKVSKSDKNRFSKVVKAKKLEEQKSLSSGLRVTSREELTGAPLSRKRETQTVVALSDTAQRGVGTFGGNTAPSSEVNRTAGSASVEESVSQEARVPDIQAASLSFNEGSGAAEPSSNAEVIEISNVVDFQALWNKHRSSDPLPDIHFGKNRVAVVILKGKESKKNGIKIESVEEQSSHILIQYKIVPKTNDNLSHFDYRLIPKDTRPPLLKFLP